MTRKLETHGKAQRVAPGANTCAKLRGYWTKVPQIVIRCRVIGGVNEHVYVVILPSVVECQCT